MMNKKDFIETAKRLIAIAEQQGDNVLELQPAPETQKRARVNNPAKLSVTIVPKGDLTPREFKNRKDLASFYKLPDSCLTNWPHFRAPLTLTAEDELIKAEAVWLGKYLKDVGCQIVSYGRYRTKHTGGLFHSVNLEEFNRPQSVAEEGGLL